VTIIPQDPILFTGTVRSNIDPFNEYSDEQIIDALKKVHIWEAIDTSDDPQSKLKLSRQPSKRKSSIRSSKGREASNVAINLEAAPSRKAADSEQQPPPSGDELTSPKIEHKLYDIKLDVPKAPEAGPSSSEAEQVKKKLEMKIEEGGSNFSLGQRQLLCMARALIRRTQVLLMDEATASIDELTDHLIQKMIKTEFKDMTVITIAHRLNTIIQYDKVMVLDQGNIVEFDSPIELMKDKESYFANLIRVNGPEFEEKMRYMAAHKDEGLY